MNVTATVQLAPAVREAPQSLFCEKSPVTEMLPSARGTLPELVKVTFSVELLVPIRWLA
jgi:hypothetical protein